MERFLSTWFVSSLALGLSALILGSHMSIGEDGETTLNRVLALAAVGLIFTIVHELVGTVVKLISLPFIVLTLGLLLVVINALLLLLTEWITSQFGVEFVLDGFWWAVLAAIVVSICQSILSAIISD
ncbi:phage holin family protein [Aeromicrobium duanguangcaii]|uniref:Phage holin family protein n=1 Tax=Aeromicrobium duanguangcaii TaxID=2968086 RepID=A0ABY5KDE4_9ACTN|nr:phage holin family protein [Aeromicrobium duanguangcaii]MCD9155383.1 phage holin family protein [Aeromicrobium duanguangcaii]MCL3838351.1 phage holin family protein [Aeromicrobium duanguangcaii]UUI68345.1 phage holin family protein [Aeromicrobium duanguangcaii]